MHSPKALKVVNLSGMQPISVVKVLLVFVLLRLPPKRPMLLRLLLSFWLWIIDSFCLINIGKAEHKLNKST